LGHIPELVGVLLALDLPDLRPPWHDRMGLAWSVPEGGRDRVDHRALHLSISEVFVADGDVILDIENRAGVRVDDFLQIPEYGDRIESRQDVGRCPEVER